MVQVNTVTDKELKIITSKKILFAHMSVGGNIIQGIEEMGNDDSRYARLNVVKYTENSKVDLPGIYHFYIGDNSFPDRKISNCRKMLLERKKGALFDSLLFKYCYVDFNKDTDINVLFSEYMDFVNRVKIQYPHLQIIHVTVPLTVNYRNWKGWLKFRIFGNHPNEKRSLFNEKLRKTFVKSDLIYDLARVEASDSSGEELFYMSRGRKVNYLSEELTGDGGHLNASGRKKAAIEMLRTLGKLEEGGK